MRLQFLLDQKSVYARAVLDNRAADTVADIQRMFFKRFPLDLDEAVEPSEESLLSVDDNAPDPDFPAPDEDALSPEAYEVALHAFQVRGELVTYRRKVSCRRHFSHKQHQTYSRRSKSDAG